MRGLLFLILLLSQIASAAPTLSADPYPASGGQPSAASFTVNGGSEVACTLVTVAGGCSVKR